VQQQTIQKVLGYNVRFFRFLQAKAQMKNWPLNTQKGAMG
jgi:hypothetical protein